MCKGASLPGPRSTRRGARRLARGLLPLTASAPRARCQVDLLPETAEAPTLSQSVGQLWDKPLVKGAVITAGGFLGITLAIGIYKARRGSARIPFPTALPRADSGPARAAAAAVVVF